MTTEIGNVLPLIPADIDSAFNNDQKTVKKGDIDAVFTNGVDPALETTVKKRSGRSSLAAHLAKVIQGVKQRNFFKVIFKAYYALSKNADEAEVDAALDAARKKLKPITDPIKKRLGTALLANIQSMVTIERVDRELAADQDARKKRIDELERELAILKKSID